MRKRSNRKPRQLLSRLQAELVARQIKEARVFQVFDVYKLFFTNTATNTEVLICQETGLYLVWIGGKVNEYDYAWHGIETLQDFSEIIGVDRSECEEIRALKFKLKDKAHELTSAECFKANDLLERIKAQVLKFSHDEIVSALHNVEIRCGIELNLGKRINE